jgi:hypothetical protein
LAVYSFMAHENTSFHPVAGIAAFVIPGAGHFILGQRKRAYAIAAGVLWLFLGGLLIGGIDVIDSKENRVWFFGQALVGPLSFGTDYIHQKHFKVDVRYLLPNGQTVVRTRSAGPNEGRGPNGDVVANGTPPNMKSIGKVNELGTLFVGIAGMMNLIAIIDAAMPSRRRDAKAASPGTAPQGNGGVA